MAARSHSEFSIGPDGPCLIGTPTQAVKIAQAKGVRVHLYVVRDNVRRHIGYAHPDGRVTATAGRVSAA